MLYKVIIVYQHWRWNIVHKKCTLKERFGHWLATKNTLLECHHIFHKCCKYLSMHTRRGLGIDTKGKMNMNASSCIKLIWKIMVWYANFLGIRYHGYNNIASNNGHLISSWYVIWNHCWHYRLIYILIQQTFLHMLENMTPN